VQPPRRWAVIGVSKVSPILLIGMPSMSAASRRIVLLVAGIHVGFGIPWLGAEVSLNRPSGIVSGSA
jgi:hypothetical protein